MATGAAALMFHHVFDGSLSMYDMDIERRPYHRNCTCALHKQKATCSNAVSHASTVSSRSSYVADSSVRSSECVKSIGAGLILFSVFKSSSNIPSGPTTRNLNFPRKKSLFLTKSKATCGKNNSRLSFS
ncbi:uncharacterized protein LOC111386829 [Olea europaea var. sylvestris]|uniref:uncharacterized protein LOC111386829 n=1 Tax=Olea europaea var. sylvestris TaxID=158386 RepID=UPI000C1CF286|nr:uncharacterized protein LOC111386829 [Olea europaea var. sylvestris]